MPRPTLSLPTKADNESITDLRLSLEWGFSLNLTDEQRERIRPLCLQLA